VKSLSQPGDIVDFQSEISKNSRLPALCFVGVWHFQVFFGGHVGTWHYTPCCLEDRSHSDVVVFREVKGSSLTTKVDWNPGTPPWALALISTGKRDYCLSESCFILFYYYHGESLAHPDPSTAHTKCSAHAGSTTDSEPVRTRTTVALVCQGHGCADSGHTGQLKKTGYLFGDSVSPRTVDPPGLSTR